LWSALYWHMWGIKMINDNIWYIMEGTKFVGVVRESNMVTGRQMYSIFFHNGYVFDDKDDNDKSEWFMCDTSNPLMHLEQSSFQGLTLKDANGLSEHDAHIEDEWINTSWNYNIGDIE